MRLSRAWVYWLIMGFGLLAHLGKKTKNLKGVDRDVRQAKWLVLIVFWEKEKNLKE